MRVKRLLLFALAAGLLFFAVNQPALPAERQTVKIIDRRESEGTYTYTLPGTTQSRSSTDLNCIAFPGSASCDATTTTNSSTMPARSLSYSVRGATFALLLNDGRVAVVNCASKLNLTEWTYAARRSCRIPIANEVEAEFSGASAKLFWSVSLDGNKTESETYKILGVFAPQIRPTTSGKEASGSHADSGATRTGTEANPATAPTPPGQAPSSPRAASTTGPSNGAAIAAIWKSITTGRVRTIRLDGDYLYGETMMPDAQKATDSQTYDLRKIGPNSYAGVVHNATACTYSKSVWTSTDDTPQQNRCPLDVQIELTFIATTRIEGRTLGPPADAKFDCQKCRYSKPPVWTPFTWIPR